MAEDMVALPQYIEALAKVNGAALVTLERPGSYPFPGCETFRFLEVDSVPGFDARVDYPRVRSLRAGINAFKVIDDNVRACGRIQVRLATPVTRLLRNESGEVTGLEAGARRIGARHGVVLACGGFEANPEMRVRYLGPGWESARVRGTRNNTGEGIQAALDIGAQAFGGWSSCHAVQWDISAPPFGDRVVLDNFQKHSYPIGIVVNLEGRRFVDEGADFRNFTYAKYGREVMTQSQRTAVQIFDAKTNPLVRDEYRLVQPTTSVQPTPAMSGFIGLGFAYRFQ
jgi:hypothetical protein